MPRPARTKPLDVATTQQATPWPNTPIHGTTPDEITAERCRLIALELTTHKTKTGTSNRDIATTTGVPRRSIDAILDGTAVPDAGTLARLEQGLRIRIWTHPDTPTPQRGTPHT